MNFGGKMCLLPICKWDLSVVYAAYASFEYGIRFHVVRVKHFDDGSPYCLLIYRLNIIAISRQHIFEPFDILFRIYRLKNG